jgi:probable phosphomutase (TIGR03848 family)
MTTILLIRHAQADLPAHTLAGRLGNIHLSDAGHQQAEELGVRLEPLPIAAIYSSPLERAIETALPTTRRIGVDLKIAEALNDLDYGRWTGRNHDDLRTDPAWIAFNQSRSLTRIPSGESIHEVASRAMGEIERLRQAHPDQLIAAVTHADVIRVVIAHCLGVAIDLALRIEISPASVSIVRFAAGGPQILIVNGIEIARIPQ